MIFDQLARASRYVGLEQDFAAAFNYLSTHDLAGLPPGRIDLQGNDLYALVQEYSTKPFEQGACRRLRTGKGLPAADRQRPLVRPVGRRLRHLLPGGRSHAGEDDRGAHRGQKSGRQGARLAADGKSPLTL